MKVCVIQPYYSFDSKDTAYCYDEMVRLLDSCDDSADIIVLPEYSDVPADQGNKKDFHESLNKYNSDIMERAIAAAKRCNSIVFVNAGYETEKGWINTTHAIDRQGNIVGRYFKAHPAPSEVKTEAEGGNELRVDYSYKYEEPYVVEIEGIRFGFMTCYDFYFYENFAPLARKNIDVIIGCSHQRTDSHEALGLINRFLCYNTNAYLIRASVSLGLDSKICGCSCIIAPDGEMLVDMRSSIGVGSCDIDPHKKFYKMAGHKGSLKAHYEYIEEGRRPWLYRNGGASVLPFDKVMQYPRLCAHRGFNSVAPENTMPAFGAAVALGASEIEFDLWSTKDGELVTAHDSKLERVSNGEGRVWEHTLSELKALDFGSHLSEKYKDLRLPTFEEILQKFAGRVIMNIHVKIWDDEQNEHFDEKLEEIASLIEKYDCVRHVYFMSTNTEALLRMRERLPAAGYCQGAGKGNDVMIETAIKNGFDKVQLVYWYPYDKAMVDLCHEHGIICNFCQADTPEDAKRVLELGVDTILTNDYLTISNALNIK